MFANELDASPPWEMSDQEWEAQLAHLIRRDPEPDLDALPGDLRSIDDDPWLEGPLADAGVDPAALSDGAIIDTISALQRHLNWAGARQARLLAEFTTRRPTATTPDTPRAATFSRWAPDEISLALSLSRITALNQLAQAVMLRDVLPAVLEAWEQGVIDVLKVRAICDACLRVPVEKAAEVAARALPRVGGQTVAQLRESLKRAVIAVDPEGANERHTEERKKRRVKLYPEEDGMATLAAYLTAPQAITAYGWLTALARGLGKDDPRTMDERRADLFAALATGNLTIVAPTHTPDGETTVADGDGRPAPTDVATGAAPGDDPGADSGDSTDFRKTTGGETTDSGEGPGSPPPSPSPQVPTPRDPAGMPPPVHPGKPLVHVLVPITTLYGADHHPVELVGYGPIPAALARDVAADAIWKRLVTDPLSGALLDHGRSTYRPPAATADFVRARDVHCRFPTCRRRALDCELDHTQAWTADHGDTSDANLYDACPHHHHIKHDGPRWTVSQHPDGTITWTTPTGHRYSSQPYDYRPEPDPPHRSRTAAPAERERPEPGPRSPFDRNPDPADDTAFWPTTRTDRRPGQDTPPAPNRPAATPNPALQRNLRRITRVDEG